MLYVSLKKGLPVKCGITDFPKSYTTNVSQEVDANITLCGKPRPTLSWMIGNQVFNGSVDTFNAEQHQYTYSFNKAIENFELCGKDLVYQAIGSENKIITGSAKILIDTCKLLLN